MITIHSLLHRHKLRAIIERWMYDELHPEDGDDIFHLVNFNNTFIASYLEHFTTTLFSELFQQQPILKQAKVKGDLKNVIIANPPYRNSRINELIDSYYQRPENYYRETPFGGTLIFLNNADTQRYAGSFRIKRVRRLAEKCAQRIIDHLFDKIKHDAEALADERALKLGIPRKFLITPPEDMKGEFIRAENRLLDLLRTKKPINDADGLGVNDVAGVKVILEDAELGRLLRLLESMPGCRIIEKEPHYGRYNALNIILEYTPPREPPIIRPPDQSILQLMMNRGFTESQVRRSFWDFIQSGEEKVYLEIIVSNYQEMIESEIGRCMHEDRIIEQRLKRRYWSHLAANVEFLVEYLFALPMSPCRHITELPIKLWVHYLPDYFDEVYKTLFLIPSLTPTAI